MADDQAKGGLIPKLVEVPQLPLPEKIPVRELPPEALKLREDMADFARKQMAFAEGIDEENAAPPDFETKATIRGEAMLNNPALMARVGEMQGEYGVPRNDVLAWEDINNAPTTMEKALRAAQFSRSKGDAFARFADHMFGAYNTETQADTQRRNASVAAGTTGSGQVLGSHTDELRRATDVDTNNARNETSVNVANQDAKIAEYEANRRQADKESEPSPVDLRNQYIEESADQPVGAARALAVADAMGIKDVQNITPVRQSALRQKLLPEIVNELLDTSKDINNAIDSLTIVMPKDMQFNDFMSSLGFTPDSKISQDQERRLILAYERATQRNAPASDTGDEGITGRNLYADDNFLSNLNPLGFLKQKKQKYFQNVVVPEENIDNMPPQQ